MTRTRKVNDSNPREFARENLRRELRNAEYLGEAITQVYLSNRGRDALSDDDAAELVQEKFPQYEQAALAAAIRRFCETATAAKGLGLPTALREVTETFKL